MKKLRPQDARVSSGCAFGFCFSFQGLIDSREQPSALFHLPCGWSQPQRYMRWLHRFLDNCQQIPRQGGQLDLLPRAQTGTESLQDVRGVIFAAVKTPVDTSLNTPPQGVKERGDRQRGSNQHDIVSVAEEPPQEELERHDQANIEEGEARRERPIDESTIDQHIDVPETRA